MSDLTQRVRAKYPGVYDDLSDADLEKAVLAKHPEYADLASKADTAVTPAAPEKSIFAKIADMAGVPSEMGTSTQSVQGRPLITGTTNAQELRGVAGQLRPDAAQKVRDLQGTGENVGAGAGLSALGGTVALTTPGFVQGLGKAALYGGAYKAGQAVGIPNDVLNYLGLIAGAREGVKGAMSGMRGAPTVPEEAPSIVGARVAPPKMGTPRGPEFFSGEEAPTTQAARAPIPRIVGGRTSADWTPPSAPSSPQQTSSIQPTPNAFVNVDKGAPLPTDEARTFSTGVTDPGERARMSETHTVLNQENNAYRAMKNDAGPDAGAVLREALLKKGATAADLTPTVGPALLQALLDSLKTGGR